MTEPTQAGVRSLECALHKAKAAQAQGEIAHLSGEEGLAIYKAAERAAELQRTFDVQWAADMRAVERWRAANPGNDLVLPDRSKLVEWLLNAALSNTTQADAAQAFLAGWKQACIVASPGDGFFDDAQQQALKEYLGTTIANRPSSQPEGRQQGAGSGLREALSEALSAIGQPADGVHTLHDDDVIKHTVVVSGAVLKRWHSALASAGDMVLVPRDEAQALLDDLNARIDAAPSNAVPAFAGIVALQDALAAPAAFDGGKDG